MLEILLLFALGKKIAAMAKEKGRSATPWVLLLVFGWIGAEIFGAIAATVAYIAIEDPNAEEAPLLLVIGVAYACALVTAGLVFLVLKAVPAVEQDDDGEDDRPRRRRLRDEDDEYEDRPRRRLSRANDEGDDDRPRWRERDDR